MSAVTMRAAVMHTPGPPSVLKLSNVPVPSPKPGQVLIRVKAFGLNRSEMYSRQGHSPGITFPRILGIEATGIVESAPGSEDKFKKGDIVATAMGGMGRNFDGGYAEYTIGPATQVQVIKTEGLSWEQLGSLPEMMQTAWGSLYTSLQLKESDHLLIRGGTTGIGLAAAALAKGNCAFIGATTRNASRQQSLKDNGADEIYIDDGSIAEQVKQKHPEGYTKVLELVGVVTAKDSMQCTNVGGIVCMTGIAGGKWEIEKFVPNTFIKTGVGLTVYSGNEVAFMETPINEIAQRIVAGELKIPIKVFKLDQIVEAHECMDNSMANAKIVVLT
ncbi:hypothetical protein P7C71_g5100, partial [Lecanoromycetidae sp. Uapishka_2]